MIQFSMFYVKRPLNHSKELQLYKWFDLALTMQRNAKECKVLQSAYPCAKQ